MKKVLFICGFAGSGKTTITKSLADEIKESVAIINLDPGVKKLPYKPNFDIRNLCNAEKLQIERNLGPNSAIINAIEEFDKKYKEELLKFIEETNYDIYLMDTPGQNEVFLFLDLGFIKEMDKFRKIGIFVIDSDILLKDPKYIYLSFIYSFMFEIRFNCKFFKIINKIDNNKKEEKVRKTIENSLNNPNLAEFGELASFIEKILDVCKEYYHAERLFYVSAKNRIGLKELILFLEEAFCSCGDFT